ncbi:MAG: hypothetical protein ACRDG4_08845 [Chloroflexota bacterium]
MATKTTPTPRRILGCPALGLLCAAGILVGTVGATHAQASPVSRTAIHAINPQPLPPIFYR